MRFTQHLDMEQDAEIEAAHREISCILGSFGRPGTPFANGQIVQCYEQINRDYSPATLHRLLVVLKEQVEQQHRSITAHIEFEKIAPGAFPGVMSVIEFEELRSCMFVQLARGLSDFLQEIQFVRMCLWFREWRGLCP